jgi:hypothetical protein
MITHVDGMTAAARPHKRWLIAAVALIVPLVLIVGAAAWFVRTYVMPPRVSIEPMAFSPTVAQVPPAEPGTPATSSPAVPETTGTASAQARMSNPPPATAPAPPAPPILQPFRYSTNSEEVWAAVPLPGPPRMAPPQENSQQNSQANSTEPIAGPVPLPPRRPRLSEQSVRTVVPLPRPRPSLASN